MFQLGDQGEEATVPLRKISMGGDETYATSYGILSLFYSFLFSFITFIYFYCLFLLYVFFV